MLHGLRGRSHGTARPSASQSQGTVIVAVSLERGPCRLGRREPFSIFGLRDSDRRHESQLPRYISDQPRIPLERDTDLELIFRDDWR